MPFMPFYINEGLAVHIANKYLEMIDDWFDCKKIPRNWYEEQCIFWGAIADKEGQNLNAEEKKAVWEELSMLFD
jgi:hypothetical protein